MSDTTDSIAGADGGDQFVDDGRDEILSMRKSIELEAVSTADGCDQFVHGGRHEIL